MVMALALHCELVCPSSCTWHLIIMHTTYFSSVMIMDCSTLNEVFIKLRWKKTIYE